MIFRDYNSSLNSRGAAFSLLNPCSLLFVPCSLHIAFPIIVHCKMYIVHCPLIAYLCRMLVLRTTLLNILKLLLFWIIVFDIQRILFSLHNWDKFADIGFVEWLFAFIYSLRLDLATSGLLSLLPLLFLILHFTSPGKWTFRAFKYVLFLEILLCAFIHGGEINAYPEWNHKLTTRVFTHLLNPDEVVRTADYSMTIWFIVYATIEIFLGWWIARKMFNTKEHKNDLSLVIRIPIAFALLGVTGAGMVVLGRGGTQQIPINIDAAYYSKHYQSNDLSVNSVYFFAKSYMLYNRSEKGAQFPIIAEVKAKQALEDLYSYPKEHDIKIFNTSRPNIVFIILESWTANAIGSLSGKPGATPYFDKLTKEGLLFSRIFATGGTSEVGNSSIFSGYPALPEVFISMQPDKHRKIPSINQDLKEWGYTSHYMFSGDLKYGNIGGFFTDHGFETVEDENHFPGNLRRGKLNYFDEDLFKRLKGKIQKTNQPFMHCAFTGSTHSPYDFPDRGTPKWKGTEAAFMNSMYYADKCLWDFIRSCKKEKWYKNTVFVLIADHGHASPYVQNPNLAGYFHVPLLIIGEPVKKEFRGKKIETLGSQADIARTLIHQLGGNAERYPWSKDLLNPNCPQFALHTINRGYGWITPEGNFSYHMDGKRFEELTFDPKVLQYQQLRCHSFMTLMFQEYQKL